MLRRRGAGDAASHLRTILMGAHDERESSVYFQPDSCNTRLQLAEMGAAWIPPLWILLVHLFEDHHQAKAE